MRGVRALVLDFDGVVVDSMRMQERAWEAALVAVLGEQGAAADVVHDAEWLRAVRARLLRNLYAGNAGPRVFEGVEVGDRHRSQLRNFKDELWRRMWPRVPLMQGVAESLPKLVKRFPVAIATSAPRDYVLDRLGETLLPYVSVVVTDADVDAPKPAADLLERIAGRLAVEVAALCMVGDTATDLTMACNAGARSFVAFRVNRIWADQASFAGRPNVDGWRELEELFTAGC